MKGGGANSQIQENMEKVEMTSSQENIDKVEIMSGQENHDQVEMTSIPVSPERRKSSTSMKSQDSGTSNERVDIENSLDGLNWKALWDEFTLRKMWTERSWKDIVKHFMMVLLLGLIPSSYDVISDGFLVNDFVGGTFYTKRITEDFDQLPNCTHLRNIYDFSQNGSEILIGQEYSCFEKDPIWGYVTLAFLLLPGFLGGAQVS